MKLRLYRFSLELLDEPTRSDKDFEKEVAEHLRAYFEAFHLEVKLTEAADCLTFAGDLEIADA